MRQIREATLIASCLFQAVDCGTTGALVGQVIRYHLIGDCTQRPTLLKSHAAPTHFGGQAKKLRVLRTRGQVATLMRGTSGCKAINLASRLARAGVNAQDVGTPLALSAAAGGSPAACASRAHANIARDAASMRW